MAKTYIGCEKYHGEPKFYVSACDECRDDLVTLPGTDIYFSDATVEWLSSQTAEGKALARLEAARQEGVISNYCLLSPSVLCGQWEAGTYVAGGVHEYQNGATLAAALTAAADHADSMTPGKCVDELVRRGYALEVSGFAFQWTKDNSIISIQGFNETPTEFHRRALWLVREQQK